MNSTVKNILLVEDNENDVHLFKNMLSDEKLNDLNFEITSVNSLAGASQAINSGRPALIILDLNLPDSKGLDTFVKLQNDIKDTPVIVFSSTPDIEMITELKLQGVHDYLVKGVATKKELIRSVHTGITGRKTA